MSALLPIAEMRPADRSALQRAIRQLENPGLVARLSDLVGRPVEGAIERLPQAVSQRLHRIVHGSLEAALGIAVRSLGRGSPGRPARRLLHAAAGGLSGAVGGAFGLQGLAAELPLSTTVILRSVADIARAQGEDPASPDTRVACLAVFALGGRAAADDAAESGYYAVRTALAQTVTEAARYLAQGRAVDQGAPVLVRLLARIAARFDAVVAEKIVAQGVPIIGAVGGAAINLAFVRHFQAIADGHFTIRRLERVYGAAAIEAEYRRLLTQPSGDRAEGS